MPSPKTKGHKSTCNGKVDRRIRRDPGTSSYYWMDRCACGALVMTRGDDWPDYESALRQANEQKKERAA